MPFVCVQGRLLYMPWHCIRCGKYTDPQQLHYTTQECLLCQENPYGSHYKEPMENITVNKAKLLEKLKTNRDAHRAFFEEAQEGFRKMVIRELDKRLALARDGKKIELTIRLPEPVDQTKDYTRAITMLEMEVGDEVTVSEYDFACYVMDDWNWKDKFVGTNSRYTKS